MDYKPTEFCKVCENYDLSLNHCAKGWDHTFCNGDEFKPSFKIAVLNLLVLLHNNNFDGNILDDIENFIYKREA